MTLGFIAPSGTPLKCKDVLALTDSARGIDSLLELQRGLLEHSGQDVCLPMSSGRAAMVLALEGMKRILGTGRQFVVIPAYTCYSVLAAVDIAGLKAILCDVDPATLDLDLQQLRQLDMSRVLCIVTANLYGIPNSLAEIESIARQNGVYMLDDSAQSLGARTGGRPAGGFGDVGIYSFDKGKNIATIQGGALVVRSGALAEELTATWSGMPQTTTSETMALVVKLVAYGILLRPTFYGLVQRLPGLGLGQTPYETKYPRTRYSAVLAGAAVSELSRLDEINRKRMDNAKALIAEVSGNSLAKTVAVNPDTEPVYLRLPLMMASTSIRERVIGNLVAAGIGATASYPMSLADLPAAKRLVCKVGSKAIGARMVASTIVTLPTHAYLGTAAIRRVGDLLRELSSDR